MSRNLVGVTLGKYRCVEFIGLGGMAEVYRAVDTELDRVVALKVLHPFLVSEEGFMERFRREARTLASLRHPNIVQVFDSGLQDFDSYVVMEYVPGPTLKDRLRALNAQRERMPLPEVRRTFDALCAALTYAHRAGIVHRDLKPTNVILAHDGRVVLTDFGLAKIVGSSIHTASMAMIGTPAYMAPEQAQAGSVDLRSDIYALGVMLYELLTGQLPFEAETPFAMIAKHSSESLPSLGAKRRDLPRALERVLATATAKDPAQRFSSVEQFAAALSAAFEGRRISIPLLRLRRPRVSRGWIAAAGVAIIAVGWVSAQGLLAPPSPLSTPTPSLTPTPRYLRARIMGTVDVHEQPDAASRVLGQLPDGTEVAVLDRSGFWWLVRDFAGGLEGWVTVSSLDFIPTPTPTATLTNTPPPGASLTPTPTPTATSTPSVTPSATSTSTPRPTPANPPSGPVASPVVPPSSTPSPTLTPTPSFTPTKTPVTFSPTPVTPTSPTPTPSTPSPTSPPPNTFTPTPSTQTPTPIVTPRRTFPFPPRFTPTLTGATGEP
jgi:serine/threonine-protein kinase